MPVPARALLRASVTPRNAGGWPALLTIPNPAPLRALLSVMVESVIATAAAIVWPST